jgi:hypothetical protein
MPLRVEVQEKTITLFPCPDERETDVIHGLGIGGITEIGERGLDGESLEFQFGTVGQVEIERYAQLIIEGLGKAGCDAAFFKRTEPEPMPEPKHGRIAHLVGRILNKAAMAEPVVVPIQPQN